MSFPIRVVRVAKPALQLLPQPVYGSLRAAWHTTLGIVAKPSRKAADPVEMALRREGRAAHIFKSLIKQNTAAADLPEARRLADTFNLLLAVLEARAGNFSKAKTSICQIKDGASFDPGLLVRIRNELADLGRHDLAIRAYEHMVATKPENAERYTTLLENAKYARQVYEYYSKYLSSFNVSDPKGYVVLCDLDQRVLSGLMVPIAYDLLKKGYSVSSMVAATMPQPRNPELEGIAGAIRSSGRSLIDSAYEDQGLQNDWVIDWGEGVVSCDGVNYFAFFLERISRLNNSYRADISSPANKAYFERTLQKSDRILSVCKRLVKLAQSTGKPIRIAGIDTHFAPWGVARKWCEVVGVHHNIHLVALSSAYENYYSNLSSLYASTVAVEDMTAQPILRQPFLGGDYRLNKFINDNPSSMADPEEVIKKWIKIDRSRTGKAEASARTAVLDRIRRTKENGGRVFCCFGKVLVDFAAPDDAGHVFCDFPQWIQFLVETVRGTNSLLLIKPHPHEIRSEIVKGGVQVLRTLLPKHLPENVVFLEHSAFNSHELAEHIDAAFVWNGTICAEFPVLGCPVIAESSWAKNDYPVGNRVVSSREEYEAIMRGDAPLQLSPETRKRATAFLRFMKSPMVAIPFRYLKRAGTNQSIGACALYDDDLATLEASGDKWVELASSRFFEFDDQNLASGLKPQLTVIDGAALKGVHAVAS